MRLLLLIAALLGLMAAPVAAVGHGVCGHGSAATLETGPGQTADMATPAAAPMPDCHKTGRSHDGSPRCALACLALCGATAGLAPQIAPPIRAAGIATLNPSAAPAAKTRPAWRLERPPRATG